MQDLRQSSNYAKYMESTGWVVEELHNNYFYIKRFPIIGSFVKLQRPLSINFSDIEKVTKKYRAFQIIVEPTNNSQINELQDRDFKLTNSPFLPSLTVTVDLTKSQNNLLSQMKKDARYAIRRAKNSVDKTNDLEKFSLAWKRSTPVGRYRLSKNNLRKLKKIFGKDALFLLSKDASGAIFLKTETAAYYYFAFTSPKGRKNYSQYKIVWEGMKWAKKRGATTLDFEGIYDSRFPLNSWKGFSHFKKSFGGEEQKFLGAYKKNRLPI